MSDKLTYGRIERRKTYELVAERLLEQIRAQTLRPGDAVPPERELVQSYGVGRSSVREALRMLESRGLIESRGNGAFAVAELSNPLNASLDLLLSSDAADYSELFEVRRILEGAAAALAASRRTRAQVAAMEASVDAMEAGLGSEQQFIDNDLRFHLVVAEATHNRVVVHLMEAIRSLLHRSLSSSYHIAGSPERAVEMHRLILEAIAAKRPEEARQRMQEHVARVERDITGRAARKGS
ncbi:MAG TPA: FadR/GntR family transcriptional regulator [Gaiellaceae bacterium]|nr:FadR/GntR family transcriptional regulator [Gaiellaceae bacterium]